MTTSKEDREHTIMQLRHEVEYLEHKSLKLSRKVDKIDQLIEINKALIVELEEQD